MYRINPKQYNDILTPTNLNKMDQPQWARYQPKRPYQELNPRNPRDPKQEYSPVPKSKPIQPYINPSYRSTNFNNKPAHDIMHRQQVSSSQSYRTEKSLKIDNSLQELPILTRDSTLPYYEPTKCSSNKNGIIKAYAANTNQGIVRDYNEDRVSIILNIVKPQSRSMMIAMFINKIGNENWPKCSFFGVYDGHGGALCADFLRDNLHQYVIRESEFPWNPFEALRKGFEAAEKSFLELALQSYAKGHAERSGSCAIVTLVVGDVCYIANVGDSRAVMSAQSGRQVYSLSRDHKPDDELETERIQQCGGKIYQTQAPSGPEENAEMLLGPMRVFPGRLSVSRTFGDIEAKLEQFGGNPKCVVAEPDIRSFKIQIEHDFIVLASDGIFDKMSSADVLKTIWDDFNEASSAHNLHAMVSGAVEAVLKESINRRTYDNITVVIVAFSKEESRLNTLLDANTTPQIIPQYQRLREEQTSNQPPKYQPLRSSLESIDYLKKSNFPQHPMYSMLKQKKNDDIKENQPYAVNKPKEVKSHHLDLKQSNDFRQSNQIKQRPLPLQVHDYNRYKGVGF